jgi:MFS family permease
VITLGVALVVMANEGILPTSEEIEAGSFSTITNPSVLLVTLYISALLLGMAEVLRDNGGQTLMPSIVGKDQLERANGRLWGAEMVMNSFVGPPAGGFLLAVAFSLPFFVDSATFAVSAGLLAALSGTFRPVAETKSSFRQDLVEGFRWLWNHQLLRRFAVVLGLINGSSAATMATLVLFGQEILQVDARGFGFLMSAGAAGGVLGSLAAAQFTRRLGAGTTIMFTLVSSAVTSALIGITSSPVVVWVMFAIGSFGGVMWNVVTVSLRQAIIPDRLLGRVNSVYRFFGWGMLPIGIFIGGALVDVVANLSTRETGLRSPFLAAAALQVVLAIYAVGRLGTPQIEAAREAGSSD